MARRFTKELRQNIVRTFAVRHNGVFNPALFFAEVQKVGAEHPAYDWFEWDTEKAALAWQIEQARDFARDLRVSFAVEDVKSRTSVRVVQREMPLVLSPTDRRHDGGGYVLTDPANPDHMAEHCRQAATALGSWVGRYRAAADHVGLGVEPLEELAAALTASAGQAAR